MATELVTLHDRGSFVTGNSALLNNSKEHVFKHGLVGLLSISIRYQIALRGGNATSFEYMIFGIIQQCNITTGE